MNRLKYFLLAAWAGYSVLALFFLGGSHDTTWGLLTDLIADYGRPAPVSPPWVAALFSLMGLWPLVIGLLLAADPRGSWKTKLLFTGLGMMGGAFVMTPWLILRRIDGAGHRRVPAAVLVAGTAVLLTGAALIVGAAAQAAPVADFAEAWQQSAFVRTMSADFLLFLVGATALAIALRKRKPHLPPM